VDTSETYIKMCEKARRIQDYWLTEECSEAESSEYGGLFWNKQTREVFITTEWDEWEHSIWLPRQDQLQEMVAIPKTASLPTVTQLILFYRFWEREDGAQGLPYFAYFTSMEQLWLAFVMKEKYNKIWNGDEWIDKRITKQDSRGKT